MAISVDELLASLGVTVDPAKKALVADFNGRLNSLETDSQAKLTDAQKQVENAQALQRVIDENIRTSGLTETNVAQLQANLAAANAAVAARDAALNELKGKGFDGINIPEFKPTSANPPKDPMKELQDTISRNFAMVGQTINEMNRYQRAFGQPLPEDPATIADRAAQSRLSIRDYMEQTYKIGTKERETLQVAEQKRLDEYAAKKLDEYKTAHPVTAGHPELGPGVPSNYPNIPKPSDAAGVRDMAGKNPMEKIRIARDRVTKEVNSRMNAA